MNTQEQLADPDTSAKPRTLKVGYKPLKSPGVEVPSCRFAADGYGLPASRSAAA